MGEQMVPSVVAQGVISNQ